MINDNNDINKNYEINENTKSLNNNDDEMNKNNNKIHHSIEEELENEIKEQRERNKSIPLKVFDKYKNIYLICGGDMRESWKNTIRYYKSFYVHNKNIVDRFSCIICGKNGRKNKIK